jgi:4-amino-4-deoxy-L-arabinose transferase-like glycosyltransferase
MGKGAEPPPDFPLVLGLLALNLAAWTLYAAISHSSEAIHEDMTEAYVWGREFQLGYYKHPPFWAWIAGLWFLALPAKGWIFSLLSVLNANIGLLGAWLLAGRFADGKRRAAATFLLLLTPCYSFLALKYNANAIFLSLWPWMAYFFIRSIDDGRQLDAASFGALSAAAILSKYYAVVLLLTCFVAACLHPRRKRYFASASPYLSAGVAALLLAPHVWWLFATGFQPIRYAEGEAQLTLFQSLHNIVGYLLACLALHGLVILLVALCSGGPLRQAMSRPAEVSRNPRFRILAALALGPVLFSAAAGVALRFPLAQTMSIGVFALVPLLLMELAGAKDSARLLSLARWSAVGIAVAALVASPLVAYEKMSHGERTAVQPRMEIAEAATLLWRQQTGTPLAIVGGYSPYADAVAFYSSDHPSEFIAFDPGWSPWITPEAIARHGFLAVCRKGDEICLGLARRYAAASTNPTEVDVFHRAWGVSAPPEAFDLLVVPPQP